MVSPPIAVLLVAGIRKLRSLPLNAGALCAVFSYGYIVALMLFGAVTESHSTFAEQRYILPAVVFGLPLAASVLVDLRISAYWKSALILLICLWGIGSTFRVTRCYHGEATMATYLEDLWKHEVLSDTSNVFLHKRLGKGDDFGDCLHVVGLFSHHPFQVLGNSKPMIEDFELRHVRIGRGRCHIPQRARDPRCVQ